ncbi:AMO-like protein [Mya arenaria]|uniref:Amine oxidase n=1 Tax=Mya arenaria TaxID=6604 RepID=A0ABY7DSA9_MYAAR|nr:AMO-like protein [Mya arenaria]
MENGSGASVGKPKEEPVVTYRRTIGLFRIVVCVLAVLVVALSIAFAVVVTQLKAEISALPGDCPDTANIDLNPPKVLPPFHDLTQEEISQVKEYLYDQTDLGLVRPKNISTSLSYIFLIDLHVPNKDQVIGYLDHGQAQPVREARVTLFMGDRPEPFIQEYTVGPLPNPYYKKDQTTFPFRNRPTTAPELKAAEEMITAHVNNLVPHILEESYDGKLGDCGKKCLAFKMISTLSTATSSDPRTRKLWFGLNPVIEFESLHSLDFAVLIDVTSSNIEDYKIDKIYYAGDKFNSLEDLKNSYEYGSVLKTRIPYPEDSRVLFETIEIVPREVDNSQWSTKPDARYAQTRMMRRQRKTEVEATVDYDFSAPKYLTFYNDKHKTETGLPRAYRILVDGMSKQMLTVGRGQEASIPWARHQLAVTKYHETERRSSSIFANFDGENPTVNFQAYIDNDEVLTDQDQVAWVTMGVHHIPHTEDLPVTSTVGLDLRFLLLPNNYFQEDPAMGSGDAVRIEPNNQNHVSQGLHIQTYGKSENSRCFPRKSNFYSIIQERPGSVFTRT